MLPLTLAQSSGARTACRESGILPSLTQHTTILSSWNQWCEQLDSV